MKEDQAFIDCSNFLASVTGSCPADLLEYEKIDCENECPKRQHGECWREYFINETCSE